MDNSNREEQSNRNGSVHSIVSEWGSEISALSADVALNANETNEWYFPPEHSYVEGIVDEDELAESIGRMSLVERADEDYMDSQIYCLDINEASDLESDSGMPSLLDYSDELLGTNDDSGSSIPDLWDEEESSVIYSESLESMSSNTVASVYEDSDPISTIPLPPSPVAGSIASTDVQSESESDSLMSELMNRSDSDSVMPSLVDRSDSESDYMSDSESDSIPDIHEDDGESSEEQDIVSPLQNRRPHSNRGSLFFLEDEDEPENTGSESPRPRGLYFPLHFWEPQDFFDPRDEYLASRARILQTHRSNHLIAEISPVGRSPAHSRRMRRRGAIFERSRNNFRQFIESSQSNSDIPQLMRRSTSFSPQFGHYASQINHFPSSNAYPDRGPPQRHRPILDVLRGYGLWVTDEEPQEKKEKKNYPKRQKRRKERVQKKSKTYRSSRKNQFLRPQAKSRRSCRRS